MLKCDAENTLTTGSRHPRHLMRIKHLLALLSGVLLLTPGTGGAQPQAETLLFAPPPGYKVLTQTRKGAMTIAEFIPRGESLPGWTEMVTVQVFHGLKTATPATFRALMESQWKQACKTSQSFPVSESTENGYPTAVWLQGCEHKGESPKDELTWFKAVQGGDSFYVVQKAFRFQPTPEQMTPWIEYLRAQRVCDPRVPERKCPDLEAAR